MGGAKPACPATPCVQNQIQSTVILWLWVLQPHVYRIRYSPQSYFDYESCNPMHTESDTVHSHTLTMSPATPCIQNQIQSTVILWLWVLQPHVYRIRYSPQSYFDYESCNPMHTESDTVHSHTLTMSPATPCVQNQIQSTVILWLWVLQPHAYRIRYSPQSYFDCNYESCNPMHTESDTVHSHTLTIIMSPATPCIQNQIQSTVILWL